ncbi:MAG: hypothetical protein HYX61_01865 [Gammaproteobacteria bacterium]|jgi:hypothetical protein|nr:hypothetical protein [Gammaproteobacteria bacterium]
MKSKKGDDKSTAPPAISSSSQHKTKALVEELKNKEIENRQLSASKAEKARQEIANELKKAKLLNTVALFGTSFISGGALWFSGVGTFVIQTLAKIGLVVPSVLHAPITITIVTGAVLGVGLYYGSQYLAAKVYDAYRSYRYSDKQRYMNDLDYQIKINVSLERQFDPTLQKAMLDRLDLLAAHAADPKFNHQDVLVSKPSYSKLTLIQYENDKLAKRANKTPEDCAKWDEKFLNKDENSIYLKLAKKK